MMIYDIKTIENRMNVSEIMHNWLIQEGYPVININKVIDEANKTIIYELKQKYFLLTQTAPVKK
jgi:hypothetical protein